MRQSFFFFVPALAVVAALSGCATMIDRTTQWVEVYTPGVDQADCSLDTPEQRYRLLSPNKVRVERSRFDIVVTCEKSGYETAVRTLPSTLTPSVFLNVFNGIIPGTSYDMVSEAIYRYPTEVEIEMTPVASKDVVFEPVVESAAPVAEVLEPLPSTLSPQEATPAPSAQDPAFEAGAADRAFDAGRK